MYTVHLTYLLPHFSSNGRDLSFVHICIAQQRCNFLYWDPAIWLSRREGLASTQGDRHLVDNAGNRDPSYVYILFLNSKPELQNLFARLVPCQNYADKISNRKWTNDRNRLVCELLGFGLLLMPKLSPVLNENFVCFCMWVAANGNQSGYRWR